MVDVAFRPVTVQELVRAEFGVDLERSIWEFENYDEKGCVGHVGLDMERIWLRFSTENLGREIMNVGGIRFVVTREDCQNQGVAKRLLGLAETCAILMRVRYLVLFTSVPGFYEHLGWECSGDGDGMVKALPGQTAFPKVPWGPMDGEW